MKDKLLIALVTFTSFMVLTWSTVGYIALMLHLISRDYNGWAAIIVTATISIAAAIIIAKDN